MSRVLVLTEHRKGALREVSLEAIGAARLLSGADVSAVVIGSGTEAVASEVARYASRVLHVDDEGHAHYEPAVWTATLADLISRERTDALLLPHSYHGMDLAGRLAVTLDRPLVTDVTGLGEENGRIVASRQVYGGRVAARVALPAGEPFIISVRPTAFEPAGALDAAGRIEPIAPGGEPEGRGVRFVEYVEEAAGDVDISQASLVVAAGRGIGDQENLEIVSRLAEALGGVLACSRPVVDRGWLPRSRQVGTSGKTIRPKVYLAVGISGAFQHVAGMKGAGRIIAINRDPHAPIFKVADYGIVGDLLNIVPAVTQAARERK
jgi:electron transfer flavoprotein alpha subunit